MVILVSNAIGRVKFTIPNDKINNPNMFDLNNKNNIKISVGL